MKGRSHLESFNDCKNTLLNYYNFMKNNKIHHFPFSTFIQNNIENKPIGIYYDFVKKHKLEINHLTNDIIDRNIEKVNNLHFTKKQGRPTDLTEKEFNKRINIYLNYFEIVESNGVMPFSYFCKNNNFDKNYYYVLITYSKDNGINLKDKDFEKQRNIIKNLVKERKVKYSIPDEPQIEFKALDEIIPINENQKPIDLQEAEYIKKLRAESKSLRQKLNTYKPISMQSLDNYLQSNHTENPAAIGLRIAIIDSRLTEIERMIKVIYEQLI